MDTTNTIDELQMQIDEARKKMPESTRSAIDAVDWKSGLMKLREKHGYTFEQLADIELETELLLCGLVSSKDYPKELQSRMEISKDKVDILINDLNEEIFEKIKAEFIKRSANKKYATPSKPVPPMTTNNQGSREIESREDMLKHIENPGTLATPVTMPKKDTTPIFAQKLSGAFQIPKTETVHTVPNITPAAKPSVDPYREIPE